MDKRLYPVSRESITTKAPLVGIDKSHLCIYLVTQSDPERTEKLCILAVHEDDLDAFQISSTFIVSSSHSSSSRSDMIPPTIVSAPGKVLVAGGYLVLDRRYTGLVVATSSRFYCVVFPQNQLSSAQLSSSTSASPTTVTSSTTDESTSSGSSSKAKITVRAGQFPEESSVWSYALEPSSDSKGLIISPESDNKNKFVEITLRNALQVVVEHYTGLQGSVEGGVKEVLRRIEEGGGLEVVVLADNDFYSQRESVSLSSPTNLPPLPPRDPPGGAKLLCSC